MDKKQHATDTTEAIMKYWRDRGFGHVKAWITEALVRNQKRQQDTEFIVRSNLVSGLPPGINPDRANSVI